MTPLGHGKGLIVCGGKTAVLLVAQDHHLRKLALKHRDGIVLARIVHHDDFKPNALRSAKDRVEAVPQNGQAVPVYDDN